MQSDGARRLVFAWSYALVLGAAAAWLIVVTLDRRFWLDDLYTIALVKAPTLGHLLRGVALGIDGNPPLYMTLAWGVARLPVYGASVEAKLLVLNVIIGGALLAVLFRIARRFVSFECAQTAIALLLFANAVLIESVLHLRTYPLFLLCAAACALFQLRLLDSYSRADAVALAACSCALAMSHTFGIAYVCLIIGSAALVVAANKGVWSSVAYLAPAVPALLVFAMWSPWLIEQLTVADPYGWIGPPAWIDLASTMSLGRKAGVIGALMVIGIVLLDAFDVRLAGSRGYFRNHADLKFQAALVALVMFVGFAAAVWIFSLISFPIFLTRYFAPNMLVYFAATMAFVGLAFRLLGDKVRWFAASVAMGLSAFAVASAEPMDGTIPCFDDADRSFIEEKPGLIDPKLPVVAVSPHAWFPRVYYAPSPATYIFPLDWDVVLKFPHRERNNAVDFHIMKRFQAWAGAPNIVTTDDLVRQHKEFYVVNESERAWLDHLKQTHPVDDTVLATQGDCSLRRVRIHAPS